MQVIADMNKKEVQKKVNNIIDIDLVQSTV